MTLHKASDQLEMGNYQNDTVWVFKQQQKEEWGRKQVFIEVSEFKLRSTCLDHTKFLISCSNNGRGASSDFT